MNQVRHNWTWHFNRKEGSPWNDAGAPRREPRHRPCRHENAWRHHGRGRRAGAGRRPVEPVRSPRLTYDQAAAKRLLAEAASRRARRCAPGRHLLLRLRPDAGAGDERGAAAAAQGVGIEVTFECSTGTPLLGAWREGAAPPPLRGCDAINVSYGARPLHLDRPPGEVGPRPPVANNWGFFNDPAYDALITRIYETFDITAQDAGERTCTTRCWTTRCSVRRARYEPARDEQQSACGSCQAQSWFQDLTPISLG